MPSSQLLSVSQLTLVAGADSPSSSMRYFQRELLLMGMRAGGIFIAFSCSQLLHDVLQLVLPHELQHRELLRVAVTVGVALVGYALAALFLHLISRRGDESGALLIVLSFGEMVAMSFRDVTEEVGGLLTHVPTAGAEHNVGASEADFPTAGIVLGAGTVLIVGLHALRYCCRGAALHGSMWAIEREAFGLCVGWALNAACHAKLQAHVGADEACLLWATGAYTLATFGLAALAQRLLGRLLSASRLALCSPSAVALAHVHDWGWGYSTALALAYFLVDVHHAVREAHSRVIAAAAATLLCVLLAWELSRRVRAVERALYNTVPDLVLAHAHAVWPPLLESEWRWEVRPRDLGAASRAARARLRGEPPGAFVLLAVSPHAPPALAPELGARSPSASARWARESAALSVAGSPSKAKGEPGTSPRRGRTVTFEEAPAIEPTAEDDSVRHLRHGDLVATAAAAAAGAPAPAPAACASAEAAAATPVKPALAAKPTRGFAIMPDDVDGFSTLEFEFDAGILLARTTLDENDVHSQPFVWLPAEVAWACEDTAAESARALLHSAMAALVLGWSWWEAYDDALERMRASTSEIDVLFIRGVVAIWALALLVAICLVTRWHVDTAEANPHRLGAQGAAARPEPGFDSAARAYARFTDENVGTDDAEILDFATPDADGGGRFGGGFGGGGVGEAKQSPRTKAAIATDSLAAALGVATGGLRRDSAGGLLLQQQLDSADGLMLQQQFAVTCDAATMTETFPAEWEASESTEADGDVEPL